MINRHFLPKSLQVQILKCARLRCLIVRLELVNLVKRSKQIELLDRLSPAGIQKGRLLLDSGRSRFLLKVRCREHVRAGLLIQSGYPNQLVLHRLAVL